MTNQIMDQMDIDDVIEVPDTPDRLKGINGWSGVKEENRRSFIPCNSWQQKFSEDVGKDEPMVIDGRSKGLSLHPPKYTSSSTNSRHPINAAAPSSMISSSSRNTHLFRRGLTDKNPSNQSRDTTHTQHPRSVRPSCISRSSSSPQDDSFIDLTERTPHRPGGNSSPKRLPGNIPAEFRKRSGLANGASSFHIPTASCDANGTGHVNGDCSSTVFGERVESVGNNHKKPVNNNGFQSSDPSASPRVNKQKRLVRNGCISPNNIAKAKQLPGKDVNGYVSHHNNGSVAYHNNGSAASSGPPSITIRELVAEDSDSRTGKGKGVVSHSGSSRGPDIEHKNSDSRSSMGLNENAKEPSDYIRRAGKGIEEAGAWRTTRNRTRERNMSSPDTEPHFIRETDIPRFPSEHHENTFERRGKGISVADGNDYRKDANMISSEHAAPQPLRGSVCQPRAFLGRSNGPRSAADTLIKRQKQGSTSRNHGECSRTVSGDPEVVFLSSSGEAANANSTTRSMDSLHQVIEVEEFSPQVRRNDHDEVARARQLEADELMARALQEQLYSEMPALGFEELDENIALALRNQDEEINTSRLPRHPVLDERVSVSNLRRQPQTRSSSNVLRRGSLARASTSGRMTRLRNRFPGQPRTILPSTGRTSLFPEDMDVDMRMHILGALEELSNVRTGVLHANRDFNENDYEALLALDDNNHQHGGATNRQINGLPQSTVQTDNFEEVCAVCLDTPTIGDTIRHLPCLHKFHKDCIDPWLRRKTSCPVCKSSIT